MATEQDTRLLNLQRRIALYNVKSRNASKNALYADMRKIKELDNEYNQLTIICKSQYPGKGLEHVLVKPGVSKIGWRF